MCNCGPWGYLLNREREVKKVTKYHSVIIWFFWNECIFDPGSTKLIFKKVANFMNNLHRCFELMLNPELRVSAKFRHP